MNEVEKDTVEDYLGDVVTRLFDVIRSLEALESTANIEKIDFIKRGQSFVYHQGVIDIVTELHKYAMGERRLDEDIKDIQEALVEEMAAGIKYTKEQKEHFEKNEGMFQ